MRWSHVGLNCRDIDTTEGFYAGRFGFQRARTVPVGDGRIVFLRRDDVYLELFSANGDAVASTGDGPQEAGAVRHLAFQVEDVNAFLTGPGDGVTIALGPLSFDEFIPGWRTVWIRDPDGVVVEVSQGYSDQPEGGGDD